MKQTCLLFFFLLSLVSKAQDGEYCIVTFSQRGPSYEGTTDYLWIIPLDSVRYTHSDSLYIYPFVIDDTKDYSEFGAHSHYWLDQICYPTNRKDSPLYSIIRKNRRLIQSFSFTIRGTKGKRCFRVKVFITPVKGDMKTIVSSWDSKLIYYSSEFEYSGGDFYSDELFSTVCSNSYFLVPYNHSYLVGTRLVF